MNTNTPLRLLNWAILWSPLRDEELAEETWQTLGIPQSFTQCAQAFNRFFMVDYPMPRGGLLLHSTLQLEAGHCREEWMRISEYLGMKPNDACLPPDHLALVCEILAHAVQQEEAILIEGIVQRYLLPWIETVKDRCDIDSLMPLLDFFAAEISQLNQKRAA